MSRIKRFDNPSNALEFASNWVRDNNDPLSVLPELTKRFYDYGLLIAQRCERDLRDVIDDSFVCRPPFSPHQATKEWIEANKERDMDALTRTQKND